jgi:hypothetical protein
VVFARFGYGESSNPGRVSEKPYNFQHEHWVLRVTLQGRGLARHDTNRINIQESSALGSPLTHSGEITTHWQNSV